MSQLLKKRKKRGGCHTAEVEGQGELGPSILGLDQLPDSRLVPLRHHPPALGTPAHRLDCERVAYQVLVLLRTAPSQCSVFFLFFFEVTA